MPKHGKGKRFQQVKRNQPVQHQQVASSQNQPAAATPKPAASPVSATAAKAVLNTASLTSQSAYVTGELKRIGVLTGIIIIVLVILSFTLA